MWKIVSTFAALSLGGCVSVPTDFGGDMYNSTALARAASVSVESLMLTLGTGETPDFFGTQMAIEQARLAVVARATMGVGRLGLVELAELGALGVTLTYCQDGVVRLQALHRADPDSAATQARTRFWPGCVMPLGLSVLQSSHDLAGAADLAVSSTDDQQI